MRRLRTILRFDDLSGLLIYVIPSTILLLLSFIHIFLLIPYVIYTIFLFKRTKVVFFYSLIISVTIGIIFLITYFIYDSYQVGDLINGIVIEKSDKYMILKSGLKNIKVYYKNIDSVNIGNRITAYGIKHISTERNVRNTFNYYTYKLSRKIVSEYDATQISIKPRNFSIYYLRGFVIKYLETHYSIESSLYLKRLILGISEFDSEINSAIKDEGILYLFAISGLHVGLMSKYIKRIMHLMNIPKEIISISLIAFLILYSFICRESSSVSRSVFMMIFYEVIEYTSKRIQKLDILTISLLINLIVNPFSIFTTGFYLTYLSTGIIYLSKEKKLIKLSFIIILFSIPIIIYSNHEVSLFILFYSLIFGVVFENVIIPFSYIVFLFYPFDFLYRWTVSTLNSVIELFNDINIKLSYSVTSIYFLFAFYFSLFLIFIAIKNKEFIKRSIAFMIILIFMNYLGGVYVFFPKIEMIDVGQGDSFLIRTGFKNILIDTGYEDNYHTTINYLKSQNINRLDAVFISHEDNDHDGELENIKNSIHVKNIYTNLDSRSFRYNQVYIDTYSLSSNDVNEASMVMYVRINNLKILFTGDIENEGEEYILTKNIGDISVLKVPHHGSNSSSSYDFINRMKPKISLISVGLVNQYGHPDKDVVKRLEDFNSTIVRTDLDGSVTINIIFNLMIIQKYRKDQILPLERLNNLRFILN